MPANDPSRSSFTLRLGVDEFLYNGLTAGGAQATFGIPPQTANYRGGLIIQCVPVPISGTITALVGQIELSLIPEALNPVGTTPPNEFGIFNKTVPVSGAPAGLSPYSGINFGGGVPVWFDLSGAGGCGKFRLNFATFTLGTATAVDVYAHLG